MDNEAFREELFNLVAYMITSARGLHDEPADYGTFRLLDTTGRLLGIMKSQDLLDPFLDELKESVDEERFGNMDPDRETERLDEMVLKIVSELQKRLD